MLIQNNKKKKLIIFSLLNNFKNVNHSLINENRNLFRVHRQIFKGNRILSNIKIFDKDDNPNSVRNNKEKKTIDFNDELEIHPVNRLNIYNYKIQLRHLIGNKEEENNYHIKSSKSPEKEKEKNNQFTLIKTILDQIKIENQNKIRENRLKFIESHDCNKRKKIKLKPLKIIPSISIDNSNSNKSLFDKKIIYYSKSKSILKNNITNNDKMQDYINNQNTSYYSTLFRNTSVNIIKNKKNGENEYENPYYSPSLKKNMWEEFQTIDNGESETIERSMMIKEGINEINNNKYKRPLYMSEKRIKNKIKEIDVTKIKSIKDIETILFKNRSKDKKNFIYKNIKLKKLNPISPKDLLKKQ